MADYFFLSELKLLKELAPDFGRAHPGLAPLLDGEFADPDVERLLEAVAFQNSMLKRKLEDDFPELVRTLVQLILPHYLRPVPATTIIAFTTHTTSGESPTIPAGTQIASVPVDGTACCFTTASEVKIHPLEICDASFTKQSGRVGEIRLSLALKGLTLECWQPETLRLFLAGDCSLATELYLLLCRHLTRIVLAPAHGGTAVVLPANCLAPVGFGERDALLPYSSHAFPGYRMLQEYFSTPEKFLFFDLSGWEQWQERGEGAEFSIILELDTFPSQPHRVKRDTFVLHAAPAVNLFTHDADPIHVNHRVGRYLVRPAGAKQEHYQVYSVDRVTGYTLSTGLERDYLPFEQFGCECGTAPRYHSQFAESLRHCGYDVHLDLAFPEGTVWSDSETLSITLTCTNGRLPDNLHPGEIAVPLSELPDVVSAHNITPVNPSHPPPIGAALHRRLASHLYLNHHSLENVEHLRALLELYVFPGHDNGTRDAAVVKRIAGIEDVQAVTAERTISGIPMRVREIHIKVRQDHFAGSGDLYLFGCVLDHFLAGRASLHSCTRLLFHEISRGGSWQWPIRLGAQLQH